MASSTVILQMHLDMAGITDAAITAAILGKTVADAADLFLVGFQLAIAKAATDRKGTFRYTLQGQSADFDVVQAQAVVKFLKTMKSTGAGLGIPVSFQ